jgi:hypothetical protein
MSGSGLVQAGLLEGSSGKGPGSGVRATPATVATLLIALLSTGDGMGKTEDRTREFLSLKSIDRKDPLTGKATFGETLTAILSLGELPKVVWLRVAPAKSLAVITYSTSNRSRNYYQSEFTFDGKPAPVEIKGMHVEVYLYEYLYEGLHEIAGTLGGTDAR